MSWVNFELVNERWPRLLPRKGNLRFEKLKSRSDWFEIYRLNDQTYAFLEPNHCEEAISYLIVGEMFAVLFDTGMGIADIKCEVSSLTNLPIIVINSHSHYDHIGGNHQFNEIWSFRNKFENDRIERGYSNIECKKYLVEGSFINLPSDVDLSTFFLPGVRITKYLHHEEKIDLGGRILTVHRTPGETPGAISLWDNLHKMFFVGDLLYPGAIWLHMNESSWVDFSRSIDYVKTFKHEIQCICPAHNEFCVSRDFIDMVKRGIELISTDKIKPVVAGENLVFAFESFSIFLPAQHNPQAYWR